jgi:orotate phosphoribosyltransferase
MERKKLQEGVLQVLVDVGVILGGDKDYEDHFVYASGRHGYQCVNNDAMSKPGTISRLCREIAKYFWTEEPPYRVVVRPEKPGDGFVYKRGYDKLLLGTRVLIVEDALEEGVSAQRVIEVVWNLDEDIVAVGAICSLDDGDVCELYALVDLHLESWPGEACPLCKAGVPINMELGDADQSLAGQVSE